MTMAPINNAMSAKCMACAMSGYPFMCQGAFGLVIEELFARCPLGFDGAEVPADKSPDTDEYIHAANDNEEIA
jgi:hypothetical protein